MIQIKIPKSKVKADWNIFKKPDTFGKSIIRDKNIFHKEIQKTIKWCEREIKEYQKLKKELEDYLLINK